MQKIQVFDPPMCCASGVCEPRVDPVLPRFAADLDWLKAQGVQVERYNLAQHPQAFVEHPIVKEALGDGGDETLPMVLVNGVILSQGRYPSREEMVAALGASVDATESLYTDKVAELVAIGAAIASNCEPCLRFHYKRAKELGITDADIAQAIATAQAVKETPARHVLALGERLVGHHPEPTEGTESIEQCCAAATKTKSCCG